MIDTIKHIVHQVGGLCDVNPQFFPNSGIFVAFALVLLIKIFDMLLPVLIIIAIGYFCR